MVLEDNHYIFRLREACLAQPEWNRHQILALDHEIALANDAATIEQYLKTSGDLLELARAGALDRAANLSRIATTYDDPWLAAAASIEYLHAFEGKDHHEMHTAILRGKNAGSSLREKSSVVGTSIDRLFQCLLRFHTSHLERDSNWLAVQSCFASLRSIDPAFCARDRIDQPRYRLRLPWTSNTPHDWLDGLWSGDETCLPRLPNDRSSEFDRAHSRWVCRLRSGTGVAYTAKPLELIQAPGFADIYLERQAVWVDPVLARHANVTKLAMQSATTTIAREAIAEDRSLNFQIEATWNSLLLSTLFAPFRAIATHGCCRDSESQEAMVRAIQFAFSLTGCGPRAIAQIPLVERHLAHNFWPRLDNGEVSDGAFQGEAGFDLLQHAIAWQQVSGRVHFEEFMSALELPSEPAPILYWGNHRVLMSFGI